MAGGGGQAWRRAREGGDEGDDGSVDGDDSPVEEKSDLELAEDELEQGLRSDNDDDDDDDDEEEEEDPSEDEDEELEEE